MPVATVSSARLKRLLSASALGCIMAVTPLGLAFAQTVEETAVRDRIPEGGQMLLEADTLVYDNDKQTVTATRVTASPSASCRPYAKRRSSRASPLPVTRCIILAGTIPVMQAARHAILQPQPAIRQRYQRGEAERCKSG